MTIKWHEIHDEELCDLCISVRHFLVKAHDDLMEICKRFIQDIESECDRRHLELSRFLQKIKSTESNELAA